MSIVDFPSPYLHDLGQVLMSTTLIAFKPQAAMLPVKVPFTAVQVKVTPATVWSVIIMALMTIASIVMDKRIANPVVATGEVSVLAVVRGYKAGCAIGIPSTVVMQWCPEKDLVAILLNQ
ncbi:MAG: hypothetical protein V7731_13390 [Amphritea sp.]